MYILQQALIDWYIYDFISIQDYLREIEPVPHNEPPICSDEFPFRMDMSYDHLLGIAQRHNMKGNPEMQIFSLYSLPDESLDVWSSRITEGLKQVFLFEFIVVSMLISFARS